MPVKRGRAEVVGRPPKPARLTHDRHRRPWWGSLYFWAKGWLHGFLGLLGFNAAGDGIEDGQLCLFNRRDGIID